MRAKFSLLLILVLFQSHSILAHEYPDPTNGLVINFDLPPSLIQAPEKHIITKLQDTPPTIHETPYTIPPKLETYYSPYPNRTATDMYDLVNQNVTEFREKFVAYAEGFIGNYIYNLTHYNAFSILNDLLTGAEFNLQPGVNTTAIQIIVTELLQAYDVLGQMWIKSVDNLYKAFLNPTETLEIPILAEPYYTPIYDLYSQLTNFIPTTQPYMAMMPILPIPMPYQSFITELSGQLVLIGIEESINGTGVRYPAAHLSQRPFKYIDFTPTVLSTFSISTLNISMSNPYGLSTLADTHSIMGLPFDDMKSTDWQPLYNALESYFYHINLDSSDISLDYITVENSTVLSNIVYHLTRFLAPIIPYTTLNSYFKINGDCILSPLFSLDFLRFLVPFLEPGELSPLSNYTNFVEEAYARYITTGFSGTGVWQGSYPWICVGQPIQTPSLADGAVRDMIPDIPESVGNQLNMTTFLGYQYSAIIRYLDTVNNPMYNFSATRNKMLLDALLRRGVINSTYHATMNEYYSTTVAFAASTNSLTEDHFAILSSGSQLLCESYHQAFLSLANMVESMNNATFVVATYLQVLNHVTDMVEVSSPLIPTHARLNYNHLTSMVESMSFSSIFGAIFPAINFNVKYDVSMPLNRSLSFTAGNIKDLPSNFSGVSTPLPPTLIQPCSRLNAISEVSVKYLTETGIPLAERYFEKALEKACIAYQQQQNWHYYLTNIITNSTEDYKEIVKTVSGNMTAHNLSSLLINNYEETYIASPYIDPANFLAAFFAPTQSIRMSITIDGQIYNRTVTPKFTANLAYPLILWAPGSNPRSYTQNRCAVSPIYSDFYATAMISPSEISTGSHLNGLSKGAIIATCVCVTGSVFMIAIAVIIICMRKPKKVVVV